MNCDRCGGFLPPSFMSDSPDAWNSVNLNTTGFGGSSAVWAGRHHRCDPSRPVFISKFGLDALRVAVKTARNDADEFRVLLDDLFHAMPIDSKIPKRISDIIRSLSTHTYRDGKDGVTESRLRRIASLTEDAASLSSKGDAS